MNTTAITYSAPEIGSTIKDHRGRTVKVGRVKALRADGKVWGVFTPCGALITRVAGRRA